MWYKFEESRTEAVNNRKQVKKGFIQRLTFLEGFKGFSKRTYAEAESFSEAKVK